MAMQLKLVQAASTSKFDQIQASSQQAMTRFEEQLQNLQ